MKRFCEKISIFLLDVDNVTEDEIDEVRFGIELILTQMILFFLLLAIGIFRNMVLETIIFIIALVGIRPGRDPAPCKHSPASEPRFPGLHPQRAPRRRRPPGNG